jgi:hypothetical protein
VKLELNSAADIRRWLSDSPSWAELDNADFSHLVWAGLVLYGAAQDGSLVVLLGRLYRAAVERLTKEARFKIYRSVTKQLDHDATTPTALLPIVVLEPDRSLASTATLDLLAYSSLTETGLPYGLMELISLMSNRVPVNMGAALGALVCFGDSQIRPSMDAVKGHLNSEEVQVAAQCATGFPTHAAIDFWLNWAKELAIDGSDDALAKFGSAASALVLQKRRAEVDVVQDVKRSYPAHRSEAPIEILREWKFADYAAMISPQLYALEAAEAPPKLFSYVLQEWGLEPGADESDRVTPLMDLLNRHRQQVRNGSDGPRTSERPAVTTDSAGSIGQGASRGSDSS